MEVIGLYGPPVSLVVPLLDDGRVVLVRQHRPVWNRSSWECPAGHAEPGESPETAARRELAEETGYAATRFERLIEVRASAKVSNPFTLFVARGLAAGTAHPDADEEIETRAFAWREVEGLMAAGEIVHAPSLVALLLASRGVSPSEA
jgi:ADP-ribose pyrophosphatase